MDVLIKYLKKLSFGELTLGQAPSYEMIGSLAAYRSNKATMPSTKK